MLVPHHGGVTRRRASAGRKRRNAAAPRGDELRRSLARPGGGNAPRKRQRPPTRVSEPRSPGRVPPALLAPAPWRGIPRLEFSAAITPSSHPLRASRFETSRQRRALRRRALRDRTTKVPVELRWTCGRPRSAAIRGDTPAPTPRTLRIPQQVTRKRSSSGTVAVSPGDAEMRASLGEAGRARSGGGGEDRDGMSRGRPTGRACEVRGTCTGREAPGPRAPIFRLHPGARGNDRRSVAEMAAARLQAAARARQRAKAERRSRRSRPDPKTRRRLGGK